MPQFTEIEKQIINAIESPQNVGTMMLGMVVKDILFQSGKSAFVICGDVTENGQVLTVCSLLASSNGGFDAKEARKVTVSFVSIMNYLVENRMVYLMGHDNFPQRAIFYQGSDTVSMNLNASGATPKGQAKIVSYSVDIGKGEVLRIDETVAYGHAVSIDCKGITLSDGNALVNVGISSNIKNELMKYITCYVCPTLALSELVQNNYKTQEEITSGKTISLASKQVDKAQKTLIVAIITLFTSFISPFFKEIGLCKCIIVIVLVVLSFAMGYVLKSEGSINDKDNCN